MGGYTPPAGVGGATAAEVWAYAARLLTNLSNTRAGYIDLLNDGTVGLTALQTLLSAIPTTPELEATALARYNALVAAIAGIPTTPELEADALVRYDAMSVAAVALAAAIGGIPTTPELEADALTRYTALLAAIGLIPTTPELEADALARYDTLTSRLTADRAGYLDNLIGSEIFDAYTHPNVVTEEDAVVITPAELGKYETLLLDLNTLTQNATVTTYIQVDGANYRLVSSAVFPTDFPTDAKCVPIQLYPLSVNMKVTLTSAVLEGATRDIPYRYVVRSLA